MEQITNKRITKNKIIYSKRVMEQLLELGFRPIETIPNPTKPEFMCWAFEWTDAFDAALGVVLGGAGNGCT